MKLTIDVPQEPLNDLIEAALFDQNHPWWIDWRWTTDTSSNMNGKEPVLMLTAWNPKNNDDPLEYRVEWSHLLECIGATFTTHPHLSSQWLTGEPDIFNAADIALQVACFGEEYYA